MKHEIDALVRAAEMLDAYYNLIVEKVPAAEMERWHYAPEAQDFANQLREIAALPVSDAEPVAWRCTKEGCATVIVRVRYRANDWGRLGYKVEPLHAAPPALPDGWVAVPVEPTEEMIEAVFKVMLDRIRSTRDGRGIKFGIVENWQTMLAAAPKVQP